MVSAITNRLGDALTRSVLVFVLSRVFIVVVSFVSANGLSPDYNAGQYDETWKESGYASLWYRWDTLWYIDIAEEGYTYSDEDISSVSWFPLYPLLIRLLSPLFPNPLITAMVISNCAFLLALIVFYRLTVLETGDSDVAQRAIFMIAFFPTGMFFFAPYTESIFLLLSVLIAYEIRVGRWWSATLAGIAASALRVPGSVLLGLALVEWWQMRRDAKANLSQLAMIVLMPLGLVAYMGYLAIEFGDPLLFIRSTSQNTTDLTAGPFAAIIREVQFALEGLWHYPFTVPMGLLALILTFMLLVPIARRLRLSYALYVLASILLPLWGGPINSIGRYVVVLFPLFMMLAIWGRNRWVNLTYAAVSLPLLSIYILLYIRWLFVG